MKPAGHIVASCAVSVFVWWYFRSSACALVSFLSGVLIDADHLIDYFADHPFPAHPKKIYNACRDIKCRKLYLFLHSYELIFLLWVLIWALSLSDIWKAFAIGLTQHVMLDQTTNPIIKTGYFLTVRIMKRFDKKSLIKIRSAPDGSS